MTYNEVDKDFSIFTNDLENAKSFTVVATSQIEVPTDYTQSQTEIKTAEITMTLNVIADCSSTKFVDWDLLIENSTTINVKDVPFVRAIGPVQDSVSRTTGNKDGISECGPRLYRIIDDSTVSSMVTLRQDIDTLTFEATQKSQTGLYSFDLEISLQDYPDIKEVAKLTLIVNPCQVTKLEHTVVNAPISYALTSPIKTGAEYSFKQVKECGYTPTLEIADLPAAFVTHNADDQNFQVETSNLGDEGDYTVTVTAKVSFAETYEENSIVEVTDSFQFTVKIADSCKSTILDYIVLNDMLGSVSGGEELQ